MQPIFTLLNSDAAALVGTITIIIGLPLGLWRAWLGRPLAARAEVAVSGEVRQLAGDLMVTIKATAKNTGTSRINLDKVPPDVSVYICRREPLRLAGYQPNWDYVTTCPVLERNNRIESSETVDEQVLVAVTPHLPSIGEVVAVRLELTVTAQARTWRSYAVLPVPASP